MDWSQRSTETPHTRDQYLLFDSHHPLKSKLGVFRTLQHWKDSIPSKAEGKEKQHAHIKQALKTCGYPNWAFSKTGKRQEKATKPQHKHKGKQQTQHPGVLQTGQHTQRLVHPKGKTPGGNLNNVKSAQICILGRQGDRDRRATTSGQESEV